MHPELADPGRGRRHVPLIISGLSTARRRSGFHLRWRWNCATAGRRTARTEHSDGLGNAASQRAGTGQRPRGRAVHGVYELAASSRADRQPRPRSEPPLDIIVARAFRRRGGLPGSSQRRAGDHGREIACGPSLTRPGDRRRRAPASAWSAAACCVYDCRPASWPAIPIFSGSGLGRVTFIVSSFFRFRRTPCWHNADGLANRPGPWRRDVCAISSVGIAGHRLAGMKACLLESWRSTAETGRRTLQRTGRWLMVLQAAQPRAAGADLGITITG